MKFEMKLLKPSLAILAGVTGLVLISATPVFAESADLYVEQANKMAEVGDYAGAAVLYQKALKLDRAHPVAKVQLRNMMLESRRQDPDAEHSDAEMSLMKEAVAPQDPPISAE